MSYGVNSGHKLGSEFALKGIPTFVVSYRLSQPHTAFSIAAGLTMAATATSLSVVVFSSCVVLQKGVAKMGLESLSQYLPDPPTRTSLGVCIFVSLLGVIAAIMRYEELAYNNDGFVEHPGHVNDVACAYRFIHANACHYGGDGNKIYVIGHSAGGHIGMLLALNPNYLNNASSRGAPDMVEVDDDNDMSCTMSEQREKYSKDEDRTAGLITGKLNVQENLLALEKEYSSELMRAMAGVISVSGVYNLHRLKENIITRYNYFIPAFGSLGERELALADPVSLASDLAQHGMKPVDTNDSILRLNSQNPTLAVEIETLKKGDRNHVCKPTGRSGVLKNIPFMLVNASSLEFHLLEDTTEIKPLLNDAGADVTSHVCPSTSHGTIVYNVGRRTSKDGDLIETIVSWIKMKEQHA
eukprot:CFRG5181T1